MGRKPSPNGRSVSRYNGLRHGAMLDDILPSLGPDRCPHRYTCPVAKEDELRHLCVAGERCIWEQRFVEKYVASGKRNYRACLAWLTEDERNKILNRLAILELRLGRLSVFIAEEGFTRPKRHPVSGVVYGIQSSLGIGRYATAIYNELQPLMSLLLADPDESSASEDSD